MLRPIVMSNKDKGQEVCFLGHATLLFPNSLVTLGAEGITKKLTIRF